MFDTAEQRRSKGNRGAIRKLRHKGKSRHSKTCEERLGKIPISNRLSARPDAANEQNRIGDFEADTVLGQPGKACLLTLADRKSRFLISRRPAKKNSTPVAQAMALKNETVWSIAPDRGKEFSKHEQITTATGFEFSMACCASSFRKVTISIISATIIYKLWLISLINLRKNAWVTELPLKFIFPYRCTSLDYSRIKKSRAVKLPTFFVA